MRARYWVKNLFVLAPLAFSLSFCKGVALQRTGLAFAAFCLAASSVYAINDVAGRDRDRSRIKNNLWSMLEDETNAWWDDNRTPGVRERRDDMLGRAFHKGYQLAAKRLGKDPKRWKWSKLHRATFRSATLGSSGASSRSRASSTAAFLSAAA